MAEHVAVICRLELLVRSVGGSGHGKQSFTGGN